MKAMIDAVGPFTLRLERDRFGMLVRSIISQQISTSAARSIRRRLQELAGPEGLNPANLPGSPRTNCGRLACRRRRHPILPTWHAR